MVAKQSPMQNLPTGWSQECGYKNEERITKHSDYVSNSTCIQLWQRDSKQHCCPVQKTHSPRTSSTVLTTCSPLSATHVIHSQQFCPSPQELVLSTTDSTCAVSVNSHSHLRISTADVHVKSQVSHCMFIPTLTQHWSPEGKRSGERKQPTFHPPRSRTI